MSKPDLPGEFYLTLGRMVRSLRKEAGATQIGVGGVSALATLDKCGPMRASALADVEGIAPASITRIVNMLESHDYVRRAPDPSDGRAQLLEVTEVGRNLIRAGTEVKMKALRERMAPLTDVELATIEAVLPIMERLSVSSHA